MNWFEGDRLLFRLINGSGTPWLDPFFRLLSSPDFGAAFAALFAVWLIVRKRSAAGWVIAAGLIGAGLADFLGARALKPWIGRVRPLYALPAEEVRRVLEATNSGSMPSLHTANFFAIALVGTLADRPLAYVAFPVATLVALSRVYGGVHWPSDLLGGAVLGLLAATLGWWVVDRVREAWVRWRLRRAEQGSVAPGGS